MKRISLLFLLIFIPILLIGCKNNEKSLEEGIQENKNKVKSIISESAIFDYIEGDIKLEQFDTIVDDDKTVFMYNILLPINPSYLELDTSEQYALLREPTQELFDFQGGDNIYKTPKGMSILNADGERIKYQSLILYFDDNKQNTFKISLDNEELRTFSVDNEGVINNVIFATMPNDAYVIFNSGMILHESEYEKIGEWAFLKSDSNFEPNERNKEVFIDKQTKEFLEWQVESGEWNKQGK